jgi:hypothetical protein
MAVFRRGALVLLALILALPAATALAQQGFRISYDVDDSRPGRSRLNGRVTNERTDDVFDVSITAEALDAKGKVLARGIAFVDSRIGRGDSRQFSVSVPTVPGATSFRVGVSSFRPGFSNQTSAPQS